MVSRRKILSRSRDDLNLDDDFGGKQLTAHFQDDTWYSKEKLYKVCIRNKGFMKQCMHLIPFQDHVEEILRKWEAIDDEIWAKVIVLERNRRVAKVIVSK